MTSRYNLWKVPWLAVIDEHNELQKVSLTELFENAHRYQRLAGDIPSQDFAILRVILAILQTTFMRYQIDGTTQPGSKKALHETWRKLWKNDKFPMEAIQKYRSKWEDRFNLYDDKYPFFQVTQEELNPIIKRTTHKKPGHIDAKLIDRTQSESNNKRNLFAPTQDADKNRLTDDELARWLITFQGYTSVSDKVKLPELRASGKSASRGWLLDLGGLYLEGDNLFETLMLNLILDKPENEDPIWEWPIEDKTDDFRVNHPENLADLYTNCSRLLTIDPKTDLSKEDVDIQAIQLPKMDIKDARFEPMTIWGKNKKGEVYPRPHNPHQSLWRSFGLLNAPGSEEYDDELIPGVIDWYRSDVVQDTVDINMIRIAAVGMTRRKGDTSSSPNGEIFDELNIHNEVFQDLKGDRIRAIDIEVQKTKKAIWRLKQFANDLTQIRNEPTFHFKDTQSDSDLATEIERRTYFQIDDPFKYQIARLDKKTNVSDWSKQWRKRLKRIILAQADRLRYPLKMSDLKGIPNDNGKYMENVVTIYKRFQHNLNDTLESEG